MLMDPEEGGFDGARDGNGDVVISETAMRRNWPNWIVRMAKRFKAMCVCDKCGVPNEVHTSLKLKREKLLRKLKDKVKTMREGRPKTLLSERLKQYEGDIMDGRKLKNDRISTVVDEITCPPITIDDEPLHKFECAIGNCTTCKDKYRPVAFEAECVDRIKYNLYLGIHQCTWHGDGPFIEQYNDDKGRKKHKCTKCEDMSEEEEEKWLKQKKPAKVNTTKYKSKYSLPMQDFVKVNGVYHGQVKEYRRHRFHRTFLGTRVALKKIREFNRNITYKSLMIQSDYSEKYQPQPDGQYQSQYFDRHQSLSMEGHATTYWNEKKEEFVLNYYAALYDEKRQDGGTTSENISRLLADLFIEKKEILLKSLKTLISISDGCSAQYRSGSVCYELCLLALQWGLPIDRVIQASGHGKCICDSQGGLDKTLLDLFFDCLVMNLEELSDGLKRVETHDRDEDGLVSLAEVCHRILSDPERKNGSKGHSNRAKDRKIDERRYIVRPVGVASGEGVKYICDTKDFEKGDGLRSNYHIRADPELFRVNERPNIIAMRRFPCFCKFCVDKMMEPIETRYSGPSDECIYWEIFKKADGQSGYNDWKLVELKPKPKGYKEEDDLDRIEVAVRGIGERMAKQMEVGNVGAYIANDDRYDYYLFKCTSEPIQANQDKVFKLAGNEFAVKKGEYFCEGLWLDKVPGTSMWHVVTDQKCVVRMQVVVDAYVDLSPWSEDNDFRGNFSRRRAEKQKKMGQ